MRRAVRSTSWHRRAGEGQKHGGPARPGADLQQVARAVVQHRPDPPQHGAAGVEHIKPDQVGVVEFVIGQRRQPVAVA
jgi:hypothetical protein